LLKTPNHASGTGAIPMRTSSPRSQRRAYLDWVEERIEAFKETIPRAQLLDLADRVIGDLRVAPDGQYQLTELLLCHAIDRHLFRLLKLPGYRAWRAMEDAKSLPPVLSFPLPPRLAPPTRDGAPAPTKRRIDAVARVG
jgi:hypothetical protein